MDGLEALQRKLHRLEPSRPIRTGPGAASFIRERRVVMCEGSSSLPVLTHAIAGRDIRGSWMADPEVHRIYRVWNKIPADAYVQVRLVEGKWVMVVPELGPHIDRIASDPARRERARADLPPLARRLLDEVERAGTLRMDRWDVPTKQARPARLLLDRLLLTASGGMHTEGGYHTAVVVGWADSSVSKRFASDSRWISYDDAIDEVIRASMRAAVVAPEREVRRWFPFGLDRLRSLVERGDLVQVGTWLADPTYAAAARRRPTNTG